ncbi:extradiol dioxygenase, partial [Mycobacterium sp. SMC-21]
SFSRDLDLYPGNDAPTTSTPSSVKSPFMVKTRSAVEGVHQFVQRTGGEVLHRPQPFPQYPPPYFAMFWLDPFGMMLEVVCHHDAQ